MRSTEDYSDKIKKLKTALDEADQRSWIDRQMRLDII